MSKENNIDRLFKEGLSAYSETPPTHVWDAINTQMNNNRKKRMIVLFWKGSVAAAFIGVIILAGILFSNKTITKSKYIVNAVKNEQLSKTKPVKQNSSQRKTSIKILTPTTNNNNSNIHELQIDPKYIHDGAKSVVNTSSLKKSQYANVTMTSSNSNYKQNTILLPLKNKDGINPVETINASYIFFLNNNDSNNKHLADLIFGYSDNKGINNKDNKTLFKEIAVGGQIAPSYSFRNSENNNANNESGITKLTGGLNINVKTSKRLRVETGVTYAQVGQTFNNSSIIVNNSLAMGITSSMKSAIKTNYFQNSMGNIVSSSSSSPMMDEAVSSNLESNNSVSSLASINKYDVEVQQVLEYVEIPLILKYDIINKGMAVSVNGGLSTNLLVGNNAYQITNDDKNRIGSMEGINSVSYSASFGLGLRTPLSSSLDFNMEPRIKYFINSITKTSGYEYKPYSIGVMVGVNYKF